jgi:trimeric autotransporter adhesin
MKKSLLFMLCLAFMISLSAQEKMYIHKSDHVSLGAPISFIDSVSFNETGSLTYISFQGIITQIPSLDIDSISFDDNANDISVIFNGTTAYVINPLAFEGVSIDINGADVTVNSVTETKDINYSLSGSTTDGMFKIYSGKRFNLILDGVSITNSKGPAINIQSENKASILLEEGTSNYLADGAVYAEAVTKSNGKAEDQKAALFSEGKMVFEGTGNLTVTGNCSEKHAICSDDQFVVNNGFITVAASSRDAVHAGNGVEINGGTVTVTAIGDGIDGGDGAVLITGGKVTTTNESLDVKGITCDSTMDILGGEISVTISGNQSKGIFSKQNMSLKGGTVSINTYGGVNLETSGSGFNPSYCSAIKCDSAITIDGSTIIIKSTGAGGKGISTDYDLNILSGTLNVTTTGNGATYQDSLAATDSYSAICLTVERNILINGGTVTLTSSGTGGKGIKDKGTLTIGSADCSPTVNVTTSGTKITISTSPGDGGWGGGPGGSTGTYDEAKAIKSKGAVTINNGTVSISSADDGIKSNTSVIINNGNLSITKSIEGIESPVITVSNGNVSITASDDGFNATMSLTAGGTEMNDGSMLTINNGTVAVSTTTGDCIDSNGKFLMTGGTVIAQGPSSAPELGMDINGTSVVSGGILIASGPNSGNNMIEGPDATSPQNDVMVKSTSIGTNLFHVQDAGGNEIITFKPVRSAYYIVFSSPKLVKGSTYSIYTGGSSTGTSLNGYYSGGTYSGGTLKKSFTISGIVTNVSF